MSTHNNKESNIFFFFLDFELVTIMLTDSDRNLYRIFISAKKNRSERLYVSQTLDGSTSVRVRFFFATSKMLSAIQVKDKRKQSP